MIRKSPYRQTEWKDRRLFIVLPAILAVTGCLHPPRTFTNPELKRRITDELAGRDLDPIEGLWHFSNQYFEGTTAIYRTDPSGNEGFLYAGRGVGGSIKVAHPWSLRDPFKVSLRCKPSKPGTYIGEGFLLVRNKEIWKDVTLTLIDETVLEFAVHTSTPIAGGRIQYGSCVGPKDELNSRLARISQRDIEARETIPGEAKSSMVTGSGFLVHPTLVITNHHVVVNALAIRCRIEGQQVPAKVLASSVSNDLALLSIDSATSKDIPTFRIGDAHDVRQGDEVYGMGFPLTSILGSDLRVHRGTISSTVGIQADASDFQVEMTLNPGNSGGPILNAHGHVIGIDKSKLGIHVMLETGMIPEGITFATKSDALRSLASAAQCLDQMSFAGDSNEVLTLTQIAEIYNDAMVLITVERDPD